MMMMMMMMMMMTMRILYKDAHITKSGCDII